MLEEIIDSKTDAGILGFFVAAPERSFSAFEITKRLQVPHGRAVHALNKLATRGFLNSFSKKSKKYYSINTKYSLYPQIKEHFTKNGITYSDELFGAIKKLGDVRAAFLSGLFTGNPNLPVDLLLVGKIHLNKLSDFLKQTAKLMGQEINYSVMTVDEFQLRRDTFDKFIRDIFDYRHITVVDTLKAKK